MFPIITDFCQQSNLWFKVSLGLMIALIASNFHYQIYDLNLRGIDENMLPFHIQIYFLKISWTFLKIWFISKLNVTFKLIKYDFLQWWVSTCSVYFDSLHPSQQFVSYVGQGLPGLNHFWAEDKSQCLMFVYGWTHSGWTVVFLKLLQFVNWEPFSFFYHNM